MNSGIAARQAAAKIFVRAPKAMGEILDSSQTPPRVKIEASRELRATAIGTGDDNRPAASEMFIIKIDLTAGGGGVEQYEKEIFHTNNIDSDAQPKLAAQPKLTVISNEGFDE